MVKFSKQFEGQLVPEWKEAFVDYWQLKKDLKKILHNAENNNNNNNNSNPHFSQNSFFSSLRNLSLFQPPRRQHGAIQVLSPTLLLLSPQ